MTELVGKGRPFYSAMDMGAKALKRKVGTGSEFLKELMGLPGVKPTELKERGLEHLMNEPKMTHEEFLGHLEKKPAPRIKEKMLEGVNDDYIQKLIVNAARTAALEQLGRRTPRNSEEYENFMESFIDDANNYDWNKYRDQAHELREEGMLPGLPQHQDYTLPGGENYREMLIKAPKKIENGYITPNRAFFTDQDLADPVVRKTVEKIGLSPAKRDVSNHFEGLPQHFNGEPGIIASMRLKDRTGPNGEKLLHLEELQSDWHQQGREHGYDNVKPIKTTNPDGTVTVDFGNNQKTTFQNDLYADDAIHTATIKNKKSVPDAPFKKNWEEMAIKRLIHHAAEKGYHGIVMTPGQEQADRYGLAKHVDALKWHPESNQLAGIKDGRAIFNQSDVNENNLANYVGKEVAQKLIKSPKEKQPLGNSMYHVISGDDLQVGGEGMKGFYDKKVPNIFNAVGKKHGVKMQLHVPSLGMTRDAYLAKRGIREENGNMFLGENNQFPIHSSQVEKDYLEENPNVGTKVHHFPITEPMREDVLKNGLPLYNTGGVIHKAEGGNVQPSVEQMRMALQNKGTFPKYDIQSIGANEAPSMSPKYYIEPGNDGHPSVGGVDMNKLKPGMQLVQQDAQAMQPPQGAPQGGNNSSPLGAPPSPQGGQSNILSMTPQGQALGAMTTQQPPNPMGMASGGSMHYAPSRPLSQSEISDMAERMVRQSKGLEMPSTTTKQQFEREKNLPIDIRKSGKEIQQPIIDYSQHLGASSVGVPGDPSRGGLVPSTNKKGFPVAKAGETLRGIGGQKLESPVGLFGGYKYGAYGHPMAWASDLGSSAGMFNVVKKLAEENPDAEILGHYHKMTPESLHHAVHMLHTVLSHHQPHNLNDEHIALLDHLMKKVAITKGKNDIPYPEFPGFKKPEEVMLHGSLKSGMRKKIIKLLGTEKYFPGGKQKMDDIMYAISHPELRNMETGSGGSAIIRFDPTVDLKSTQSLHPTYGHDIPSKLIGRTRYITPAHILAPRSMANAEREIKAMGKKVVPFNQAKMNIIREPIDEQYVNQMGEYEHEMKKRLGYKKGGKVANMDTMRLELSKKTKKA